MVSLRRDLLVFGSEERSDFGILLTLVSQRRRTYRADIDHCRAPTSVQDNEYIDINRFFGLIHLVSTVEKIIDSIFEFR